MQPKHSAIVAGLTLALSFGAVTAPAPAAAEEPTPGVASDATDIDKGLYTQQSFSGVLRSVQGVSFVNVTKEMKYFTKYESHGNYNQGFSYGDGYNALGYYQFDRRWSLIPFMKQAYNYNPEKYSMLKDAIDRGGEISNASNAMYENGQLTELGRIAQEAFQGAYNTDPAEFSALQDAYAYNSYYAVTEAWLKSGLGIDISGRADCVKGMVWSITNMCGTGGCRDFFRWANLSNDMTDREFVTALSNSVVDNVATKYSSQPQYHEGWKNRYKNELKDCLVYIAEDEAAAAAMPSTPSTPVQPEPTPAPSPTPDSNDDSSDDVNDDRMDAPSTDADSDGSAGDNANNGPTSSDSVSNGSDSNGSAAGDSPSNSTGNTDSDASGSTGAGTSNSSTGSSDSSVGTGSNNGSGSDATPGSDASKDDSNKAPDVPVASPDKKPSFSEQLGSTLGSSLMAGVNNGSTQNKGNSDQVSTEKIEAAKGDSKDKASEKTESDKGSSSEEKSDKSEQKKDEDKKSESEEKDKSKAEGEKKQSEDDDKSGADNQVQEQNGSKTVTTTTTTTTTTKSSGGNMPKTGDLIVMASLASASLATLGATSIVSGKHKLDQQKKASGEDGSEE